MIGSVLANKYKIKSIVGIGGMAVVYKAYRITDNKVVAVKVLNDEYRRKPDYVRRFESEARAVMSLSHPNIIGLLDVGIDGDAPFIVLEFATGKTLKEIIDENGPLSQGFAVKIISQVLSALAHAHEKGVIHRDIKPQNILLNTTTKVLQFCDFGSAKRLKKDEPNVSYICSRYYRAPELIFNAVNYSNAIDVWSVGCVIAEMILGYPLFQGDSSIDQLAEIIKVLGTPSRDEITSMNPHYTQYKFPLIKCYTLREVFHRHAYLGEDFFDLMLRILIYEPNKRIKPLDALAHPFFDSIREKGKYNKDLYKVLFYFSQEEINNDKCGIIEQQLIPKWYKDIRHHGDYDSD